MHHLEQTVPAAVTSWKDLTMQREDGILNIYCMSTRDYLKLYGEDKYWNLDLKEDFMKQTGNLWKGIGDKYEGQIFKLNRFASQEEALTQMKVERELKDAIAKHGEIRPPTSYEDNFFERINSKKKDIAAV